MTQGHPFNRMVLASCSEDPKAIPHPAPPVREQQRMTHREVE